VRLNGKPVVDARYNLAPRRIVVLLDMSGSMTGEEGQRSGRLHAMPSTTYWCIGAGESAYCHVALRRFGSEREG